MKYFEQRSSTSDIATTFSHLVKYQRKLKKKATLRIQTKGLYFCKAFGASQGTQQIL